MIKYSREMTGVCFEEIPDYISLGISISNCLGLCEGCHSPELRQNVGVELTKEEVDNLLNKNKGINCVLFLGEGNDRASLIEIIQYIKEKYNTLKIALYSGRNRVENEIEGLLDFIKIGPYIPKYGPLNKETTNQRLYEIKNGKKIDITEKFWKR